MRKTFISFIIIQLIIFKLLAQTGNPFIVNVSQRIDPPKGFKQLEIVKYADDQILVVNYSKEKKYLFQLLSDDFKPVKENTVDVSTVIPEKVKYKEIIRLKEKLFFLFLEKNSETDMENFYAIEFSPVTLNFVGSFRMICEAGKLGMLGSRNQKTDHTFPGHYNQRVSIDGSSSMIATKLADEQEFKGKDQELWRMIKEKIGVHVFDNALNKNWSADFEIPYIEKCTKKLSISVSNAGDGFMLMQVSKDGKVDYKGVFEDYRIEGLIFSRQSKEPFIIPIVVKGYKVLAANFHEDQNNNIYIIGQYSNSLNDFPVGLFISKVDQKTNQIVSTVLYEYTSFVSNEVPSADKLIKTLSLAQICNADDGSLFIIMEKSLSEDASHMGAFNSSSGTYTNVSAVITHLGDLFVFKINKEGKQEWVKKIVKNQKSLSMDDLSVYCLSSGNNLNIFFNDNLENQKLIEEGQCQRYGADLDGYIAGVRVNDKGVITKFNLVEHKDIKGQVNMYDFIDDGKGNILNKKKTNFISISIE